MGCGNSTPSTQQFPAKNATLSSTSSLPLSATKNVQVVEEGVTNQQQQQQQEEKPTRTPPTPTPPTPPTLTDSPSNDVAHDDDTGGPAVDTEQKRPDDDSAETEEGKSPPATLLLAPKLAPKIAPPPPPPEPKASYDEASASASAADDDDDDDDYDFVTESDSEEESGGGGVVNKEVPMDGRYLLVKKIGEGATASAHLCLDLAEGNRVVILKNTEKKKFRALPKPAGQPPASVATAAASQTSSGPMTEIAVLKKLAHANVIRLYNVVDDPASPTVSLVLEYANGGDLGRQIAISQRGGGDDGGWGDGTPGGLHPRRLWHWCRDVVRGLAYMHKQGVIHRDIKPDNILLDTGGDASLKPEFFTAKLADFGASVITARTSIHSSTGFKPPV